MAKPVSTLMSKDILTCGLEDSSRGVLELMTDRRVRHIPVVDEGMLCVMDSIEGAVKARLDEVTQEAEDERVGVRRRSN